MADAVIPQPFRAWSSNGNPVSGALATFFLSGTTTPATVYADTAETVPHPSPLVADAWGLFPAIYRSGVALKCVLTDAGGATLPGSPIDPVPIAREGGGAASEITFIATADLPYANVQAAIEGSFAAIRGQTKTFTAPIRMPVGTTAACALASTSRANSGLYFEDSGMNPCVSVNGSRVAKFYSGLVDLGIPIMGAARQTLTGFAESVGGTANAITVDMPVGGSLITGMSFRFIPASQNTGATTLNLAGTGVKSCVTISGAGLPAAYLRTGIPTTAYYNGTYWVLDREPEYGSNANGEYWRYASGLQVCRQYVNNDAVAWSTADGSLFRSASAATWTFPAPFVDASTPSVGGGIDIGATPAGVNFTSLGASSVGWYPWSAVSRGAGVPKRVMLTAINNWY